MRIYREISRRMIFVMAAMLLLSATDAKASPPPPAIDDCSSLRIMDFSRLGNGLAPTKVMFGAMVRGKKVSEKDASQFMKRSRAMGAPIGKIDVLPDHCLVTGYVNPHIKFELRLPNPDVWNGKFLLGACDGFCGKVSSDQAISGVVRKYATMTTDGGHLGEHPFDGIWAMDNTQARIDFGYRANHVLLMAAKAIVKAYYGELPKYSYLTGCSKGGQAGLMAAQRFPDDFDGILSRGPTLDYTKVNILRCGATAKAVTNPDGTPILEASRTPLILRSVMDYCDEKDGLKDRLISDPRKCDFDPAMIQCKAGDPSTNCLSAEEVAALRKLYAPVKDKHGNIIYEAGVALGSEQAWPKWALPMPGGEKTYTYKAASEYLKYFAFRKSPGPDYDWRSFDWADESHTLVDMAPTFDAVSPDIRNFKRSGGKMIIVHGWADAAIPAEMTVKWYDEMTQFMGGRKAAEEVARLFLLPGVQHCNSSGVGPSTYDALTALEEWVEHGKAPNMMRTLHEIDGEIVRTRPAYPYPLEAKYKGRGSIDDAKNFKPFDPTR